MAHPIDYFPEINTDVVRNVQKLVETFFYYAHAVEPTILVTLNTVADEQSKRTQETAKKVVQLINYVDTHPEAITLYHSSVITLHMHHNRSFLSAPVSKSREGGITT